MTMTTPSLTGPPGVSTVEQLLGPTISPSNSSPSVAGFAGEHFRGPSGYAILCNSWSDFVRYFGGFNPNSVPVLNNPYLPYSVYQFFANGGQSAFVARITNSTSPGATATLNIPDAYTATPQTAIVLEAGVLGKAGNPGQWANGQATSGLWASISLTGASDSAGYPSFNMNIYAGGAPAAGTLVEQWTYLSMNPLSNRFVTSIINSPSQGSTWVVVVSTPATSAPSPVLSCPGITTGLAFSGGTDPLSPPAPADKEVVVTAGTSPFDKVQGLLNINLPAEGNTAVIDAAGTYASGGRPYTFLVVDPPQGAPVSGLNSVSAFLASLSFGANPAPSYVALYYPWVYATNPASSNPQNVIDLPPGGFILGQIAATDNSSGPWEAPAGTNTVLANVVAAEDQLTPGQMALLNNQNVNALRTMPDGSVVIWGTRTLEIGFASKYIPVRRTLNYIESALVASMQQYVFDPNSSSLWGRIIATCNSLLSSMYAAGAFPGGTPAQSYYVICDDTINTPQTIASGVTNVVAGVALAVPSEFIQITIAQFQSTGATSVSTTST
jgi:phage tail sheath protein FI